MSIDFRQRPGGGSPGAGPERGPILDFRTLRLRLYAVIAIADGFAMLAAFLLADLLRFGQAQGYGLTTFMVMFPTYVAVGLNGDSWSIKALRSPRHSAGSATRALLFAIAVATVIFFTLKIGEDFSRLVFGIGSCLALLLIAGGRLVLGRTFGEHYGWSFRKEVLLVDGMDALPEAEEIVVDARAEGLQPSVDDPQMLDRPGAHSSRKRAGDRRLLGRAKAGMVTRPGGSERRCRNPHARARVDRRPRASPPWGGADPVGRVRAARASRSGREATVRYRAFRRLRWSFCCRCFALVALAIRIESPGPVFFRQQRLGRGNRLFGDSQVPQHAQRCE